MGSSSWIVVCTQFWRVWYFAHGLMVFHPGQPCFMHEKHVWEHVLRGSNAGQCLYHTLSARQASPLIAPHQQGQCSWWWWNSIFSWGRRVVRLEAKLRNTPSQLETKERAAKGPIAQSWLTAQYTTHTYTCTHTVIIYLPSTLLFLSFFFFYTPIRFLCSPFLLFLCLFSFPLCIIFESLPHFHGDPTADKDSFTVSQFRHILSSAVYPPLLAVNVENATLPSTTSAVFARTWFPLAEPVVIKAGCHKSIWKIFHGDMSES